MTRTRRSSLAMASGLMASATVAVTSFATAPYLLDRLGVERFGLFRAALGWFGLLGLLEFGVGGALQALFARALGSDDRAEVVAAVQAGARAYLLLAGSMAIGALGLLIVLPELIRVPASLVGEFRVGCGLNILTFVLLPLSTFRPLIEAEQRGYRVNLLLAAQALVAAFAMVVFARAGWGMVGQFAALLVGSLVFHFGLARDGIRRYPEVLARTRASEAMNRSLWSLSWPTFVFNLSGRVGLASDELVVAGLLGPAAVASFFLTQRVITVVGSQMFAIGGATWAGLIDLHFRGEQAIFDRRLTQLTRLTAVFGAGLLLPVAVRNRDLIVLWVGPDRYAGEAVTWLAAANTWCQGIVAFWLWPLGGAGLVRKTLPAVAISAAINLVVSLGATALVGAAGPLIGTAAAVAGVGWWWALLLLRRHLGVATGPLLRAAGGPALLAVGYGVALIALAGIVPLQDPAWPRWVSLLALAGWLALADAGYFALAALFVFPAADRIEWAGRFRNWWVGGTSPTIAAESDPLRFGS